MAISVVATQSDSALNGGNVTLTFSGVSYTAQQGDVLVVTGGFASSTSGAAGPSTAGYTQITLKDDHATSKNVFGAWYKVMGATPDTTFVGLGSGAAADSVIYTYTALRGVSSSTVLDVISTTAGVTTSTNPAPSAITTVTSNTYIVIGSASVVSDATVSPPSGYTNDFIIGAADTNPFSVGMASKALVPFSTETPGTWTNWSSGAWFSITMALRDAFANTNLSLLGVGT